MAAEDPLKVLAHPLRSRLLATLRLAGPASATALAAALSTNSGATSYHLRKLESVGLVTDSGEGRGRERLWRATSEQTWAPSQFIGDDDAADTLTTLDWLNRDYAHHFAEQYDRWLDVSPSWPVEWQDVAGSTDSMVLVTHEQLAQLRDEVAAVVERFRRVGQGNPQARRIATYTFCYPLDLDRPPQGASRS
jgi:DNA-binding transcriptional ArsR family regulator